MAPVQAQWGAPQIIDEQATMEDRLGDFADLSGSFVDEDAREVELADLVSGERPVVLNIGYFNCPGMCGLVLNALLKNVEESGQVPGRDFDLVTVSFDHREGPKLAHDKKSTYVETLGNPEWAADWHLLTTPSAETVRALTDSVGWRFRFDADGHNHDHPPMIVVLSPTGVTTRYLDARYLDGTTFRRALVEAGDGTVGTFVERFLATCLTFDPSTGAYSLAAMTVMQVGGLLTLVALSIMIILLWRRERQRQAAETATEPSVA